MYLSRSFVVALLADDGSFEPLTLIGLPNNQLTSISTSANSATGPHRIAARAFPQ